MTNIQNTVAAVESMWEEKLIEARKKFADLKSISSVPDVHIFLRAYDRLSAAIEQVSAPASLFSNVHPDAAVRSCAEKFEQAAQELASEISLDVALYKIFAACSTTELSPLENRLYQKIMRDYKRSGVNKDDATRAEIQQLRAELVELGQIFERNIREDVRSVLLRPEQLAGLPQDFIDLHQPNADGFVTVTTDYPDLRPFLMYADDAAARKELFIKFNTRAYPTNESVLRALIEKRHALATLLGYASWADYVTEDKMIQTSAAVQNFIDRVDEIARPKGVHDYAVLLAEKQSADATAHLVEEWEKSYWEERVKRRMFNADSLALRPYFEYTRVRDGLLAVSAELFGIEFEKNEAATWHASVEVYDVLRDEKNIGRIYLDMHPRDFKYKHAAQFTLQSGIAGEQLPEGVLVCNFSDPTSGVPALMDHDQVTTFFHEFGHLLHHILGGAQEFIYFSGVATEWDFVEAPSQFFEEWSLDPKTLQRFAHHVETNEPVPTELIERARAADEFGKGLFARRQMAFAALSLNCYRKSPEEFDVHELAIATHNQYAPFLHMPETHHECSFGHLDGYSAIYYTYMWSLVIAKDLLSAFTEGEMLNTEISKRYAKTILERGGTQNAADLVANFLGRPYSFDAFRTWLTR